jgi:hypothetical protein
MTGGNELVTYAVDATKDIFLLRTEDHKARCVGKFYDPCDGEEFAAWLQGLDSPPDDPAAVEDDFGDEDFGNGYEQALFDLENRARENGDFPLAKEIAAMGEALLREQRDEDDCEEPDAGEPPEEGTDERYLEGYGDALDDLERRLCGWAPKDLLPWVQKARYQLLRQWTSKHDREALSRNNDYEIPDDCTELSVNDTPTVTAPDEADDPAEIDERPACANPAKCPLLERAPDDEPCPNYKPAPRSEGVDLIAAERRRQVEEEGWTAEHDEQWINDQLSRAAACYALAGTAPTRGLVCLRDLWPWDNCWWRPKTRVANLVRAGALIAAELDRMARAEAQAEQDRRDSDAEITDLNRREVGFIEREYERDREDRLLNRKEFLGAFKDDGDPDELRLAHTDDDADTPPA